MRSRSGSNMNDGEAYNHDGASKHEQSLPLLFQFVQQQGGARQPAGFFHQQLPCPQVSQNHQLYSLATHNPNDPAYHHNYQFSGQFPQESYPGHQSSYIYQDAADNYGHGMSTLESQPSIDMRYATSFQEGQIMGGAYHHEQDISEGVTAQVSDEMPAEAYVIRHRASSGSLFLPSDEEMPDRKSAHSRRAAVDKVGSPIEARAQSPVISGPVTRSSKRRRAARVKSLPPINSTANRRLRSLSTQLASPRSDTSTLGEDREPASANKRKPEHDPENHHIKYLRTVERLGWPEIVAKMNDQRIANGKEATYSEAAVYGRFKRNAPKIALLQGDHEFDASDWMYMKKKKHAPGLEMRGVRSVQSPTAGEPARINFSATLEDRNSQVLPSADANEDDEVLLHSLYEEIGEDTWDRVASKMHAVTGNLTSAAACEERYRTLMKKTEEMSRASSQD